MLQYLLNATAIWLISLVMFDVFLRKESYHGYNRFYLLFTFVLGAFLPLIQWQDAGRIYVAKLERPIETVIATKQNIMTATAPAAMPGWTLWLAAIYLSGIIVAACLLIIDIVKLATLYRNGDKSYSDGWTVIETSREHAPFSFRNILFVCSKQQYSADEWNMILVHERRHTALFHFIDLLLMQAGRIIFWFHPLVYIYNKRILLVHEYQADNASSQQPRVYGQFLVEQALLQSAPSITHSFNRSPIKNRIVMLTRRSSAASRVKMLVFIPLALVCTVCFSKNSFSQKFERKGNTVIYRGNTFEYNQNNRVDTQIIVDPVTGEEITKYIKFDPQLIKMNGEPIPQDVDKNPTYTGKEKDLRDYLLANLKKEIGQLEDGQYTLSISDVLIDRNGKIVYFNYEGGKKK